MGTDIQEDSSIEQASATGEKLSDPEDSTSQNPLENVKGIEEKVPTLTSENLPPEERSQETLVPDEEARGLEENPLDPKSEPHAIVDEVEASASRDADDTGVEDIVSVDQISDLLGIKPLDFEVIDFDQFGAQPPDLPLIDDLDNEEVEMKVNQHGGIGESTETMKPEDHITDVDANSAVEQASEDNKEHDVHSGLDSEPAPGGNGISEPPPPETVRFEEEGEASSESAVSSLSSSTEAEVTFANEEIQEPIKELDQPSQEQAKQLEETRHQVDLSAAQLEEQSKMHEELQRVLEIEREERLKSDVQLLVVREMLPNMEEKLKNLHDQVLFLEVQLQEQVDIRNKLEENLEQERNNRMQYVAQVEEQRRLHEELAHKLDEERDERHKSETNLKELRRRLSSKEEELEDLHKRVVFLAAQLQEQKELKQEIEDKLDQEYEERKQDAVMVSDHSSESLPVSSMPRTDDKLEFAKLLDEQKTLLANQVQEAATLKNAAEMKVGMLRHQVQNLEVLSDIAETMEYVFTTKERAIKQALWTVFQAFCVGIGLMYFVVAWRDPLRSSLPPT